MSTSSTVTGAAGALRDLLPKLYDTFRTGDAAAWTEHLADDVLGFGTDPAEFWTGAGKVAEVVAAQARELHAGGMRMTPGDPRITAHGDTAWAVDRPALHLADGGEVPARLTLVATLDGGELRIRHFHFSVGVRNEDALGQELPT
jgi:ketosteroid isomerase-like protein